MPNSKYKLNTWKISMFFNMNIFTAFSWDYMSKSPLRNAILALFLCDLDPEISDLYCVCHRGQNQGFSSPPSCVCVILWNQTSVSEFPEAPANLNHPNIPVKACLQIRCASHWTRLLLFQSERYSLPLNAEHKHTGLFLSLRDFKTPFAFMQWPMQDSTCYLSGCGSLADGGGGFETDMASRSNRPRASSKRLLLSEALSQPYVCVLSLLKGLKRKAVCWRRKGCKCCLINS